MRSGEPPNAYEVMYGPCGEPECPGGHPLIVVPCPDGIADCDQAHYEVFKAGGATDLEGAAECGE